MCVCVCLMCRGKEFGHDVDFIIKTPEAGQEDVILPAVIERFKSQVQKHLLLKKLLSVDCLAKYYNQFLSA